MVVLLLLASTIAGSSALISASKPLSWVSFATYGSVLVLAAVQVGGLLYNGGSLLAALFVFYLVYMSRQIYATARDMLLLRDEQERPDPGARLRQDESDEARARRRSGEHGQIAQFLANMSHELRTPLNAILGFSEIISTSALNGDTAKDHEYAGLINTSGHHLLRLINDILDLAKIEAGQIRHARSGAGPGPHDRRGARADDAQGRSRRLPGWWKENRRVPAPICSPTKRAVNQVLLNLLFERGQVHARGRLGHLLRPRRGRRAHRFGRHRHGRRHRQGGSGACLPEIRPRPPRRVVTADHGTGLGLPIVKGLVEAHGGSVVLESELRRGHHDHREIPGGAGTAGEAAGGVVTPQTRRISSDAKSITKR